MATKDLVLEALQRSGENYLSGEALSEELGISRTAVWKAIRILRDEGYTIKAVTNRGYHLIHEEDVITEKSLREHLFTRYKNNRLYIYDTLDSTNNRAKQLALENAPHGTTVIAMQQTAGKGRLGRSFFSPREGIYLSIIIKPTFDLSKSVLVTAAAAVAIAQAIESVCGRQAQIKWVNDVYLDGKKICGHSPKASQILRPVTSNRSSSGSALTLLSKISLTSSAILSELSTGTTQDLLSPPK